MARLIVTTNDRNLDAIVSKIKATEGVVDVSTNPDTDSQTIIVTLNPSLSHQQVGKIVDDLTSWSNVQKIPSMVYGKKTSFTHLFFDVDGTLISNTGQMTVDAQVQSIFDQYARFMPNSYKYLATGRDEGTVRELMRNLRVEPFAIAENGGIIIGDYPDGHKIIGDKDPANKFWRFLINKNCDVTIDDRQHNRRTEIVIMNTINHEKMIELKNEAKSSGINVSVLRGGKTYHITKEGIDKGNGLSILRADRGWGEYDVIVSVGDSELDLPMFRMSHKSYLRGIARPEIKIAAKGIQNCKQLAGSTLTEDLIEILDDFGKITE